MKADRRSGLRYDNTPRRLPPARRSVPLLRIINTLANREREMEK